MKRRRGEEEERGGKRKRSCDEEVEEGPRKRTKRIRWNEWDSTGAPIDPDFSEEEVEKSLGNSEERVEGVEGSLVNSEERVEGELLRGGSSGQNRVEAEGELEGRRPSLEVTSAPLSTFFNYHPDYFISSSVFTLPC